MPSKRRNSQGMTLVEMVVVAAICSILFILTAAMLLSLLTLVDNQTDLVATNQRGMKLVDDIGALLDDAVIPMHVNSLPSSGSEESAWDDINSPQVGFGGTGTSGTGAGGRWRQALIDGVDNLAFTQVVKVLGSAHDNRYDKDDPARSDSSRESRVLLGQVRGNRGYLGAGIQSRTNPLGKYRFDFRDSASEPVNILARLDPDKFNSSQFEAISLPETSDWQNATLSSYNNWPNRTAFMAIRYLPLVNPDTNAPWIINEANGFRGEQVDLDGDGLFTGTFQIGRLQLLYSGGTNLYAENAAGTALVPETLDQLAIDLCGDVVLRYAAEANRVPIFQLAATNPEDEDDDLGSYLRIRLLLVDNAGVGSDGLRASSPYVKALTPLWRESGVFMNNMRR